MRFWRNLRQCGFKEFRASSRMVNLEQIWLRFDADWSSMDLELFMSMLWTNPTDKSVDLERIEEFGFSTSTHAISSIEMALTPNLKKNSRFDSSSHTRCTATVSLSQSTNPKSRIPTKSWPYLDQKWLRIQILTIGSAHTTTWHTTSHASWHNLHFT